MAGSCVIKLIMTINWRYEDETDINRYLVNTVCSRCICFATVLCTLCYGKSSTQLASSAKATNTNVLAQRVFWLDTSWMACSIMSCALRSRKSPSVLVKPTNFGTKVTQAFGLELLDIGPTYDFSFMDNSFCTLSFILAIFFSSCFFSASGSSSK